MDKPPKKGIKLTPIQVLVLGYILVTLVGAFILSLPVSSAKGAWQPFIDSLFVSTSGISTSGLSPVDIGTYYSLFGQIVLMCIFQVGGIGYMTFFVFIAYLLGRKMSMQASITAKQSLATDSLHMLGRFFKNVLLYTFIFEVVGAVALAIFWMGKFSTPKAIYLGVFHSISAFCTAGFSVFSSNLMDYKGSLTVNLTVNIISIIGGIGFFVLTDVHNFIHKKRKNIMPRRLTVHSRLALSVTLAVMLSGAIIIFMSEKWPKDAGVYDKIMASSFQAISASTTDGYNTLDINAMSLTSLTVLMALMFIGASPGSTGGGMKTTTFGVLIASVKSYLHGKTRVSIFKRELPDRNILEAFTLFGLFSAIVLIDIIILANLEKGSYVQTLFEIISALGNTGLSTGITSGLTFIGKLVLIMTMFIGRVGPLTIAAAFIAKVKSLDFKYAQEEVFIG